MNLSSIYNLYKGNVYMPTKFTRLQIKSEMMNNSVKIKIYKINREMKQKYFLITIYYYYYLVQACHIDAKLADVLAISSVLATLLADCKDNCV